MSNVLSCTILPYPSNRPNIPLGPWCAAQSKNTWWCWMKTPPHYSSERFADLNKPAGTSSSGAFHWLSLLLRGNVIRVLLVFSDPTLSSSGRVPGSQRQSCSVLLWTQWFSSVFVWSSCPRLLRVHRGCSSALVSFVHLLMNIRW